MKILSLYLFYALSQIIYSNGEITKCEKTSSCSCLSDAGVINLAPLAVTGAIRFQDIVSPSGDRFSWNPCLPFTEEECQNVAACRITDTLPPKYFNIGTQDSAKFAVTDGVLSVSYTADTLDPSGSNFSRTTTISLVCDASQNPGFLTVEGESPPGSANYLMTLRSAHACPLMEVGASAATLKHGSAATLFVPTTTGKAVTLSPSSHALDYDLDGIKMLLVGQVVMLTFIMIMLLILMLIFGYKTCRQGGSSRANYDQM